jgi:hypothetical protein
MSVNKNKGENLNPIRGDVSENNEIQATNNNTQSTNMTPVMMLRLFSRNVLILLNSYALKGLGIATILMAMWQVVAGYFVICVAADIGAENTSYCVVAWLVLVLMSAGWDINVSRMLIVVPTVLIGICGFYIFIKAYMSINNATLVRTLEFFDFVKLERVYFTKMELKNHMETTMLELGIGEISKKEASILKRCKTPEEIDAVLKVIYDSHNTVLYTALSVMLKTIGFVGGEGGKSVFGLFCVVSAVVQFGLFANNIYKTWSYASASADLNKSIVQGNVHVSGTLDSQTACNETVSKLLKTQQELLGLLKVKTDKLEKSLASGVLRLDENLFEGKKDLLTSILDINSNILALTKAQEFSVVTCDSNFKELLDRTISLSVILKAVCVATNVMLNEEQSTNLMRLGNPFNLKKVKEQFPGAGNVLGKGEDTSE